MPAAKRTRLAPPLLPRNMQIAKIEVAGACVAEIIATDYGTDRQSYVVVGQGVREPFNAASMALSRAAVIASASVYDFFPTVRR